jgi:preprotein translocase SecF subunit
MVISTEGPADLGKIRSLVSDLDLGDVQVQEFGSDHEVLIRVETQVARSVGETESIQQDVPVQIRAALDEGLSTPITVGLVEVVGPKVSGELVQSGALAVIAAVALMLVYIWFRFEWQFSLGAVIALVHDVILTIGVFSLTRIEFNLSIIAALLTIVGYSMNDTVVIYDRVRENLRKYKKMDLSELIDHSLNETLARTSMTSVTTLLALIALYVFGGEVIRGFTFAMMWGVVVGTYSSIFVAAPILLITGVKRDWSQSEEKHVGAPV